MSASSHTDVALPSNGPDSTVVQMSEQVCQAVHDETPLRIVGGDTKAFYGRSVSGIEFNMSTYAGIVGYEPTELVITAKAGTLLSEINQCLNHQSQMLGFEPPQYGPGSTIGGAIASGLSGPARPYWGAVRDHVLGVEIINGHGQLLRFGGQVIKNVAGFDVSRLMAGALGTLGVITRVSLRVLPQPERETTLVWSLSLGTAQETMLQLARKPWPLSAMAYDGEFLRVRVSGGRSAVEDAISQLKPDKHQDGNDYWEQLRDQQLSFFKTTSESVWRLSLPPVAPDADLDGGRWLWDWGGAQRWLSSPTAGAVLREHCATYGGHATCFINRTSNADAECFTQPSPALMKVFSRLKKAFDPKSILNPGRFYGWM